LRFLHSIITPRNCCVTTLSLRFLFHKCSRLSQTIHKICSTCFRLLVFADFLCSRQAFHRRKKKRGAQHFSLGQRKGNKKKNQKLPRVSLPIQRSVLFDRSRYLVCTLVGPMVLMILRLRSIQISRTLETSLVSAFQGFLSLQEHLLHRITKSLSNLSPTVFAPNLEGILFLALKLLSIFL
jgi:hypothetical protein